MNIKITKFLPGPFIELAIDQDNGTKLIGIPFDHGGSGHTRYYALTEKEYEELMTDESQAKNVIAYGNTYVGSSQLYFSDFLPDSAL